MVRRPKHPYEDVAPPVDGRRAPRPAPSIPPGPDLRQQRLHGHPRLLRGLPRHPLPTPRFEPRPRRSSNRPTACAVWFLTDSASRSIAPQDTKAAVAIISSEQWVCLTSPIQDDAIARKILSPSVPVAAPCSPRSKLPPWGCLFLQAPTSPGCSTPPHRTTEAGPSRPSPPPRPVHKGVPVPAHMVVLVADLTPPPVSPHHPPRDQPTAHPTIHPTSFACLWFKPDYNSHAKVQRDTKRACIRGVCSSQSDASQNSGGWASEPMW